MHCTYRALAGTISLVLYASPTSLSGFWCIEFTNLIRISANEMWNFKRQLMENYTIFNFYNLIVQWYLWMCYKIRLIPKVSFFNFNI